MTYSTHGSIEVPWLIYSLFVSPVVKCGVTGCVTFGVDTCASCFDGMSVGLGEEGESTYVGLSASLGHRCSFE